MINISLPALLLSTLIIRATEVLLTLMIIMIVVMMMVMMMMTIGMIRMMMMMITIMTMITIMRMMTTSMKKMKLMKRWYKPGGRMIAGAELHLLFLRTSAPAEKCYFVLREI